MKRRITFRLVRRVVTALLGVLLFAAVAAWYVSPDVRYVVRAGVEEARILLRRKPIAALVDPQPVILPSRSAPNTRLSAPALPARIFLAAGSYE